MSSSVQISRENNATIGSYRVEVANQPAIKVQYTRPRQGVLYITHASLSEPEINYDIVDQVMARIVSDARDEGARIIVLDQTIQSVIESHPEWTNVIAA